MFSAMLRTLVVFAALVALPAAAVENKWDEGDLLGFPALFDEAGERIGSGEFNQQKTGSTFEVTSIYRFKDGRVATEVAKFSTKPELIQKSWKFEEKRGEALLRKYEIDFDTGLARGEKHNGTKVKRYNEKVKIEPGKSFAGLGFVFAAKQLFTRLRDGEVIELTAIAFTPKPRAVNVELKSVGQDTLNAGSTVVKAERITVHPKIPSIAKLFVKPKDAVLWFARRSPPQFLRSESTLAEPEEAVVQINSFGSSAKIGRKPLPKRP